MIDYNNPASRITFCYTSDLQLETTEALLRPFICRAVKQSLPSPMGINRAPSAPANRRPSLIMYTRGHPPVCFALFSLTRKT